MEAGRLSYVHGGQKVYEWDQALEEVNVYLAPPRYALPKYLAQNKAQFGESFVTAKFDIVIRPDRLTIGLKGQKPFIDVR